MLLDDKEGLCANLISAAGGDQKAAKQVDAALDKLPKVEGSGSGSLHLTPPTARTVERAGEISEKGGDSYITVEHLLIALAMAEDAPAGKILKDAGATPQAINTAVKDIRKGRKADTPGAEGGYDALNKYTRDLTEVASEGKLDPVIGRDEEIRRTIQVLSAGQRTIRS